MCQPNIFQSLTDLFSCNVFIIIIINVPFCNLMYDLFFQIGEASRIQSIMVTPVQFRALVSAALPFP